MQLTVVDDRNTVWWFAGASFSGAQHRTSWRDYVRQHGDANILVDLCGPITGLKEIVEFTQLTVEGTITVAQGKLTAKEERGLHRIRNRCHPRVPSTESSEAFNAGAA
jgi:hypothetical protein